MISLSGQQSPSRFFNELRSDGRVNEIMESLLINLIFGLIISFLVAIVGKKKGWLTQDGAITFIITTSLIFGFGGLIWFLAGLPVLITGSFLSDFRAKEKAFLREIFQKGTPRDAGQVFANGGIPALIAVGSYFVVSKELFFVAYLGALSVANADTWATEIGVLSKTKPRLITTWKPVEAGTSGAISLLGTITAFLGSLTIYLFSALLIVVGKIFLSSGSIFIPVILGGLAGMFFDSLLGATVQGRYFCKKCKKFTEKSIHGCGSKTTLTEGFRWFTNDLVNIFSIAFGALVASILYRFI